MSARLLGPWREGVTLLPRLRTPWGSWAGMCAAVAGMRAAVHAEATHVVVMSGQDLPLVDIGTLETFFGDAGAVSFFPSVEVPNAIFGPKGGADRFRGWHRPIRRRDFQVPFPNPLPKDLSPRIGAFWCALDSGAVRTLLTAFADRRVWRSFSRIQLPEEAFIPMILDARHAGEKIHEYLWYIDWSIRTFGIHAR